MLSSTLQLFDNDGNDVGDLDDLAGSWVDDPEFDAIIAEMDQVDPELWK